MTADRAIPNTGNEQPPSQQNNSLGVIKQNCKGLDRKEGGWNCMTWL